MCSLLRRAEPLPQDCIDPAEPSFLLRLTAFTAAGATTTYAYDVGGQRVRKSSSSAAATRLFAYDPAGHLLGEYDANGAPVQEFVWLGDIPVAVLNGATALQETLYVYADHLGAPRILVDTTGAERWRWVSEPFGSTTADPAPAGLATLEYNLRFPGQYFDKETGLNYNYFRNYDSTIGRYTQSDPIGLNGGINTYAYANGSPVSRIDSTGLVACAGGVWDEDPGDLGLSAAFGGYLSVAKIHMTCRSNPAVKVYGRQVCIGGGLVTALGAGWVLAGTTYNAPDSSDLGGWSRDQGQILFGPFGVQAPVNGDPGGSLNIGKGIGGGVAYTSCYTEIIKIEEPCPDKK